MGRGAHAGAGLLTTLVPPWGTPLEQPIPEGLHFMGRTRVGAVCGELCPMGGTPRWGRGRV